MGVGPRLSTAGAKGLRSPAGFLRKNKITSHRAFRVLRFTPRIVFARGRNEIVTDEDGNQYH